MNYFNSLLNIDCILYHLQNSLIIGSRIRHLELQGAKVIELNRDIRAKSRVIDELSSGMETMRLGIASAESEKEILRKQLEEANFNVVETYTKSESWKTDANKYVEASGVFIYLGGWNKCTEQALSHYPHLDQELLDEPRERLKKKKSKHRGKPGEDMSENSD